MAASIRISTCHAAHAERTIVFFLQFTADGLCGWKHELTGIIWSHSQVAWNDCPLAIRNMCDFHVRTCTLPSGTRKSLPSWFNDFPARNLHFDRPFRSHPHTQLTCLKPINQENKLWHETLNHENKLRHKLVTYHFYRLNLKTKTCKWTTQYHKSPIVKAIYSTTS